MRPMHFQRKFATEICQSSFWIKRLTTFLRLVCLVVILTTPIPVLAQVAASTGAQLTALERHLFSETYPTDTTDQRLARLDNFVFGRVRKGTDTERLNSLLIDVPSVIADSDDSKPVQSVPALQAEKPEKAQSVENSDGSVPVDYPTVTALENEILGHTEENLPIEQRLANLEIKAFGKASPPSGDLAIRVDKLKSYELSKNGNNEEYLASSSPIEANSNRPVQTLDISSQLNLLEKTVFAKTYSHDGIISRLDRLEKTVYPAKPVDTFSSVPARVSRLMTALQIQTPSDAHRARADARAYKAGIPTPTFSYPAGNGSPVNANSTPSHHSFWHKVGSVLGGIGEAAAMSMGSGMMYGGYPGYGYGGGMYGGGMYGGYPGYGGMYGGGGMFNRGMY